jgi:hypothetical protein
MAQGKHHDAEHPSQVSDLVMARRDVLDLRRLERFATLDGHRRLGKSTDGARDPPDQQEGDQ